MTCIPKIGDHILFETGMKALARIPLKFHPDGPPFSDKLDIARITIGECLKKEVNESFFSSLADELNSLLDELSGCDLKMISGNDIKDFFRKNNLSISSEVLDTSTYAGEYIVTKINGILITCQKLDDSQKILSFSFTPNERALLSTIYSFYDPESGRITR